LAAGIRLCGFHALVRVRVWVRVRVRVRVRIYG